MDPVRPLHPKVLDRDRREDGRDLVVHSLHRPERSVDVRGGRSDVPEEARRVSVRILQRVPEHVSSFTLQETCNDGSDVAPCVVDSSSDVETPRLRLHQFMTMEEKDTSAIVPVVLVVTTSK